MTPEELYLEATLEFKSRRYAPGLMMALIDFFQALDTPTLGLTSFDDFLLRFPAIEAKGKTLRVKTPSGRASLRPRYQAIETYFRDEKHRGGYPSAPDHATTAASEYPQWLDTLVRLSSEELAALRARLDHFVLEQFQSDEFDPSMARPLRRPFRRLLLDFQLSARTGEPRGAALQGAVFGFLRADNPHLQVQIWKVHTGSSRKRGVGDIDCWAGRDLVISAEVKQFKLDFNNIVSLTHFADAIHKRNAIGIIVALDITKAASKWISDKGLIPLTLADMVSLVALWDDRKQDTAMDSFTYYVEKTERNEALTKRLRSFLRSLDDVLDGALPGENRRFSPMSDPLDGLGLSPQLLELIPTSSSDTVADQVAGRDLLP